MMNKIFILNQSSLKIANIMDDKLASKCEILLVLKNNGITFQHEILLKLPLYVITQNYFN